jgi:hypothetical protein
LNKKFINYNLISIVDALHWVQSEVQQLLMKCLYSFS